MKEIIINNYNFSLIKKINKFEIVFGIIFLIIFLFICFYSLILKHYTENVKILVKNILITKNDANNFECYHKKF